MIEFIFTIDYEIYGNGEGSLRELVYEPAKSLMEVFEKWNANFVTFVEVAELEIIEASNSDPAIALVKHQIHDFYDKGFELGLHLHPQWYNGKYENGKWRLDYDEYNLCKLPLDRIDQIVVRSIKYLRDLLGVTDFTPFSFRAGNWLFQPTHNAGRVLVDQGIKVDSSVFKGGLQHQYKLDYRRALKNGYYWYFVDDVNVPNHQGTLIELPIYTKMAPLWKLPTAKRIGLQRKVPMRSPSGKMRLFRLLDFLRLYHPLKLDFCRMTLREITHLLGKEIRQDKKYPELFRPIIAIGHTKDLVDLKTVDSLLIYLRENKIPVSTFRAIYQKYNFNKNQNNSC
ncbi:MAG: hypothetical protein LUQ65_02695 [Candidatus Helarchaeota archaeon]|nr:hypothetical protein [Candidatus Helarchaeota archaeon]